jgi:hypothetical protein
MNGTHRPLKEATYCVVVMLRLPSLILDCYLRAYCSTCFPRHASSMAFEEVDRLSGLRVLGTRKMYAGKHTFTGIVRGVTIMFLRY